MRVIVAGSRRGIPRAYVYGVLDALEDGYWEEIVQGGANGVDSHAKTWANSNGLKVTEFKADWNMHGRGAGPIRNTQMAEYGDMLIAIWDGSSAGTADMIRKARSRDLQVLVFPVGKEILAL